MSVVFNELFWFLNLFTCNVEHKTLTANRGPQTFYMQISQYYIFLFIKKQWANIVFRTGYRRPITGLRYASLEFSLSLNALLTESCNHHASVTLRSWRHCTCTWSSFAPVRTSNTTSVFLSIAFIDPTSPGGRYGSM